jgi:hypothetical protein
MKSSRWKPALLALAAFIGIATSGCGTTWVVVPHPAGQFTATDTLYGIQRGEEVRVTFHFDTIMRVDTVLRVDTAWRAGTRTLVRVDTLLRVDTVQATVTRTLMRVDTVRVPVTETLVRVDTVRVLVTDTVIRTVRVPGQRVLFVPPGHYPPRAQCRVWIHDLPPGQQARPGRCDALGEIPSGAFVLFGGDAWDFDYDWIAEATEKPGTVPPEIIALKRRN